jgi:hypothetical protein
MGMMTEYESQHNYWLRDHDVIMAEIEMLNKTDNTWTVIRLLQGKSSLHSRWSDCVSWCLDTWGLNDEWVYTNPGAFTFKNEEDAVLFVLRWA